MRLSAIFEDVESRIPMLTKTLIGKKSRWPWKDKPNANDKAAEVIRNAGQWDPTNGGYLQFIVRDIAGGKIRLPEDGASLKETLEIFAKASKKALWAGHKDIMQYDNWRELQAQTLEWTKKQEAGEVPPSEREWINKAKEGASKILETTIESTAGPIGFSVIEARTPIAVTVYGRGTQWCTSCSLFKTISPNDLESVAKSLVAGGPSSAHASEKIEGDPWGNIKSPEEAKKLISALNDGDLTSKELKVPNPYYRSALSNAVHYLKGGPMYIVNKNGQPYIQMTNNGRELRNVQDQSLRKPSPVLAKVFERMIETGKLSAETTSVLNKHIENSGLKQLENQMAAQKLAIGAAQKPPVAQ